MGSSEQIKLAHLPFYLSVCFHSSHIYPQKHVTRRHAYQLVDPPSLGACPPRPHPRRPVRATRPGGQLLPGRSHHAKWIKGTYFKKSRRTQARGHPWIIIGGRRLRSRTPRTQQASVRLTRPRFPPPPPRPRHGGYPGRVADR